MVNAAHFQKCIIMSAVRTEYEHSNCIASPAIGSDGFTLFDGCVSVVYDKSLNHSKLVKEICEQGVKLLYVADERTMKKMKDVQQSYPHLIVRNMRIVCINMKNFDKKCAYCQLENCHR